MEPIEPTPMLVETASTPGSGGELPILPEIDQLVNKRQQLIDWLNQYRLKPSETSSLIKLSLKGQSFGKIYESVIRRIQVDTAFLDIVDEYELMDQILEGPQDAVHGVPVRWDAPKPPEEEMEKMNWWTSEHLRGVYWSPEHRIDMYIKRPNRMQWLLDFASLQEMRGIGTLLHEYTHALQSKKRYLPPRASSGELLEAHAHASDIGEHWPQLLRIKDILKNHPEMRGDQVIVAVTLIAQLKALNEPMTSLAKLVRHARWNPKTATYSSLERRRSELLRRYGLTEKAVEHRVDMIRMQREIDLLSVAKITCEELRKYQRWLEQQA